jgi:hypothetical protein
MQEDYMLSKGCPAHADKSSRIVVSPYVRTAFARRARRGPNAVAARGRPNAEQATEARDGRGRGRGNRAAKRRLVRTLPMEQIEEWAVQRC